MISGMGQPIPVIRELYLPALIPQALAIATLALIGWLSVPAATIPLAIVVGAVLYGLCSRLLRRWLVHDHTQGMAAYRAQRFEEAIRHFEKSYAFFSAHRQLDAWRSLILGVASRNPYRIIALGNQAWCHAQLGNGGKAMELFEQVLREAPDHMGARTEINMLRAGAAVTASATDKTRQASPTTG